MTRLSAVLIAVLLVAVAACSSDAKKTLNQAGARTAAEAMRAQLKAADLKSGETVRSVAVLQNAADNIPGSPDISGIADANHDGKDDDGKVTVTVGSERACLSAQDNGTVDVSDGAC